MATRNDTLKKINEWMTRDFLNSFGKENKEKIVRIYNEIKQASKNSPHVNQALDARANNFLNNILMLGPNSLLLNDFLKKDKELSRSWSSDTVQDEQTRAIYREFEGLKKAAADLVLDIQKYYVAFIPAIKNFKEELPDYLLNNDLINEPIKNIDDIEEKLKKLEKPYINNLNNNLNKLTDKMPNSGKEAMRQQVNSELKQFINDRNVELKTMSGLKKKFDESTVKINTVKNYNEAKISVEQLIGSLETAIDAVKKDLRVKNLKDMKKEFESHIKNCSNTSTLIKESLDTINSSLKNKKLHSLTISKSSFVNFVKQKLFQPVAALIQKLKKDPKDPYEIQIKNLTRAADKIAGQLNTIAKQENKMGFFQASSKAKEPVPAPRSTPKI